MTDGRDIADLRRNQASEAASVIVRIGTYFGVALLLLGIALPGLFIVSIPGFAVYFGLRRKLKGDAVWLDPYGVWVGALIVNAAWLVLFLSDPAPTVFHLLIVPCSLLSFGSAGLGLVREIQARRATLRSRIG